MKIGLTLKDGDDVGDSVARVADDTREQSLGIEHQHSLNGNVNGIKPILFKHDFNHPLTVLLETKMSPRHFD